MHEAAQAERFFLSAADRQDQSAQVGVRRDSHVHGPKQLQRSAHRTDSYTLQPLPLRGAGFSMCEFSLPTHPSPRQTWPRPPCYLRSCCCTKSAEKAACKAPAGRCVPRTGRRPQGHAGTTYTRPACEPHRFRAPVPLGQLPCPAPAQRARNHTAKELPFSFHTPER